MKHNMYRKIFGWFAAAVLLLTSSCKDDLLGTGLSEQVEVTFTITPEAAVSTRATGGFVEKKGISDGTKVDMLIYAVYEKVKDGDGYRYELLEGYGDGNEFGDAVKPGKGQTVMKIPETFPMKVNLMLKRGSEYAVAFWAQSSKAKDCYDTKDLKKVEVNYSVVNEMLAEGGSGDEANGIAEGEGDATTSGSASNVKTMLNNDEFRDAFCRSVTFTAGASGSLEQNVYLYRPLAQINVGTSGFDYEIATRGTNTKYTYSKIRINRVARYLDVVADEIYASTTDADDSYDETKKTQEAFVVVDFDYAPIPAYVNYQKEETGEYDLPALPSYTYWDWDYDETFSLTNNDVSVTRDDYANEEFLKVKLYDKDKVDNKYTTDMFPKATEDGKEDGDGYLDYANYNNREGLLSETFKYLSMCYVLTKSTKEDAAVINNVKVWLAADKDGSNEIQILDLNHVPAQRNWRTNILGNLLTEEQILEVRLDRDFAGEYNGLAEDGKWKDLSGPLAKGVYYDAENDEIQISDADGLIWFQKMVNGTMTVREALSESYLDKSYKYYDSNGKVRNFTYKGIEYDDSNPELMKRILIATHQISREDAVNAENLSAKWPVGNNFHFTRTVEDKGEGKTDDPATVRLMADIDLSGIEWIPIGFECRMIETMYDSFGETERVGDSGMYSSLENVVKITNQKPTYRGFFGIFDGNNHTISNMKTKRFSARVHDDAKQGLHSIKYKDNTIRDMKPTDNPQWFGRGLFGQIGGNAKIRNVRLLNVDVYGCNGVAGIVGIAHGDKIEITNCAVDGGSIIATPMYRGDAKAEAKNGKLEDTSDRTFARGVYLGGIVGYFRTDGGILDNCEVKNLYLQGYRRAGGLIGSIGQRNLGDADDNNLPAADKAFYEDTYPSSISNNKISNTVIIASQYSTFGMPRCVIHTKNNLANNYYEADGSSAKSEHTYSVIRSGFGWDGGSYRLYSNKFVGGHTQDYNERADLKANNVTITGNVESSLTFAEFTIYTIDDEHNAFRYSEMQAAPLKHMPMLSSWYADNIVLNANYYGEPSAYTRTKQHLFKIWSTQKDKMGYELKADGSLSSYTSGNSLYDLDYFFTDTDDETKYNGGNTFAFPIQLPEKVEIDWVKDSPRAGLYVESVTLDGNGRNSIGGRSVVTPTNVTDDGACVVFVTARNRHQFNNGNDYYKKPTVIKNMVLRGQPYANAGILVATNKNMNELRLENVAIYDVYKTIAMDDWKNITAWNVWPNTNQTKSYDVAHQAVVFPALNVTDCNLRGYTAPSGKWYTLTYTNTTFEKGTYTGHGEDEYTYKAETAQSNDNVYSKTVFKKCFFKAPYIIDISEAYTTEGESTVTFEGCYATATSTKNVEIGLTGHSGCKYIIIRSTAQGDPTVEYTNEKPTNAKRR